MTLQVRIDPDTPSESMLHPMTWLFLSSLNIPINYQASIHPMTLLPSIASPVASNIADHLSKPLPTITHQRIVSLIGTFDTLASATTTSVDPSATVAPTTTLPSDSVPFNPNLDPAPLLPVIDTGAPHHSVTSFASDFALEVSQASYGLIRSAASVAYGYSSKSSSRSTLSNDPYTLITGEDTIVDLSSPDTVDFDSDSGPTFTKVSFDIKQFGTASLTFIYSKSSSELLHIFVDPNQID